MPTAYNEKTGEILVLGGDGQWSAPKTAKNPQTGEELYLDGNEWKPSPAKKPDPYANLPLEEIQKRYKQRKFVGSKPEELAGIADAYVRKEQAQGGFGLAVDDTIRSVARGVPILGGALDEINAAGSALMGGDYNEALDYQRARDRFMDKKAPVLSTGLQVAGGVASGLGAAKALGLGGQAAAAGVPTRMLPTVPQALASGGVGVGVGGADMYARGEGGVSNRALNAAIGGAFGGVLGVAAPYVGGAFSAGTQRVLNFLSSDQALQRLGISREAANVLIRQLSTDDTMTATGAQRIREAGPDAMLADAGQAATNLLDTSIQRSGPGSTAARQAIEQRAAGANRGLANELDNTFGQAVGVETRQGGIRQGTAAARATAYDAAYDIPIDYASQPGRHIEGLMARLPQEAINQANRLMRGEGQASRQIRATLNDDGTVTMLAMPDVRQLDYITRALNEVARGAEGQGAMGGTTAAGRIYGNLAQDIRQNMRQAVPEYGVALDTAADPIRRIQAIEFGSTLLNDRVTREQVAQQLAGASTAERRAVVQGVRDQIDEVVANVKGMASDPNVDARQLKEVLGKLSSPAARQKLTTILGEPAARSFFTQINRFERATQLRAAVATNSRTFGRTATDAQVKAMTEPGVIGSALEGNFGAAIKKAVQGVTGATPERRLAMEDRLYGEIARALTNVRGRDAETMLRRLRAAVQAQSANQTGARAIGAAGTGVTAGGGQAAIQSAISE